MPSLHDLHHQQLIILSGCWVDRKCLNGAVTVSIDLLHTLGGNKLVIGSSEQMTYQLPYLQDTTLWRLR